MSLLSRELTEEERRSLEKLACSQAEEFRLVHRARIVLAASKASHMCDVVRALDTDRHSIRRWTERFLALGLPGLRDRARSGAPHRFNSEQVAKLVVTALTPPEELGLPFGSWTHARLSAYLQEHEGFYMSATWIGVLLKREGMRWVQDEQWFSKKVDPEFLAKRGPSSSYTGVPPQPVPWSASTRWGR